MVMAWEGVMPNQKLQLWQ